MCRKHLEQTRQAQLGSHAIRDFEQQAEPVVFTAQSFLVDSSFNGDCRDMTGVLDQAKLGTRRSARFAGKNRKRPQNLPFAGEQWTRPNRTNPITGHQAAIVIPKRVSKDVGYVHWFSAMDSRAAR